MNNTFRKSLLGLTLLATLPFAASAAEGVSYNFVEGGYVRTDTDFGDAEGFGGNGSFAIAPNFHIFGGFSGQEVDDFDFEGVRNDGFDIDLMRVGLGYNHEISSRADLVTRVAYERAELAGESFNGYSVEAGVRGSLAPNFEGYAMAGFEDGRRYDGDFYGRVGAQVKFSPRWGVSGDVKISDGDTQLFIGPRITF